MNLRFSYLFCRKNILKINKQSADCLLIVMNIDIITSVLVIYNISNNITNNNINLIK